MQPGIVTLIVGLGLDGRDAVLGDGRGRSTTGRLVPPRFDDEPEPQGVVLPGHELALQASERARAEALWGTLSQGEAGDIGQALARLVGEADAAGRAVVLAVDARSEATAALPWELLTVREEIGTVLRLVGGPSHRSGPPGRPTLAQWVVDAAEPTCRAVAQRVAERCPDVLDLEDCGEGPLCLHIVAHGVVGETAVGLALGHEGVEGPDGARRRLGDQLDHCRVLLLSVCHGGAGLRAPGDSPAARLAATRVPVVVAASQAFDSEAAGCFASELLAALGEGSAVLDAVRRARQALSVAALPTPRGRWWTPRVLVSDLAALSPSADLAALTELARQRARLDGWFGVEHLLESLVGSSCSTPLLERCRAPLERLLRVHPRVPGRPGQPRLTPRLAALLPADLPRADLPLGDEVDTLLRRLLGVPWLAEALPAPVLAQALSPLGEPGGATVEPPRVSRPPAPTGPGLWLEVQGGPEDGRLLQLSAPGQVLGRWSEEIRSDVQLGRPPGPWDPTLSRQHLRWLGGRRLEALAAVRLDGAESDLRGELRIRRDTTIRLGSATCLRVLAIR